MPSQNSTKFNVKDTSFAPQGENNIAWAATQMGTLAAIEKRFKKEQPFKDVTVGMALHVTKETANLVAALVTGGAQVAITGCNPLSTQDDVAAALAKRGVNVFAWKHETNKEYYENLNEVIRIMKESKRKILATIDDGLDLVTTIHQSHSDMLSRLKVGTEETTTGVIRLAAMANDNAVKYPVIAVNDNQTKHLFDNYYGTGQSTIDGILRATAILFAGKKVVVVGYGHCGKGVAIRAQGMGSNVTIVEVDPIRSLQAQMDGYTVLTMNRAALVGDVFITVTGNKHVISASHIKTMKSGAILANSGHFDLEIDVIGLKKMAKKVSRIRPSLDEYNLGTKKIYLCGEGRLVNLAAAEGHPSEVMDMSFAGQALALEYGLKHDLLPGMHQLPSEVDQGIAATKLQTMGVDYEKLTSEQYRYSKSWQEGT